MRRLTVPVWAGAGSIAVAVLSGARGWAPLLAFGLGGFAGGSALRQISLNIRKPRPNRLRGLLGRSGGGMIVHVGVVLIGVALAASNSYVRQSEFTMVPYQSATFAGHEVTYLGSELREHPNRVERVARVRIDDAKVYAPAVARYPFGSSTIGIPSVRSTWRDDVALSVVSFPEGEASVDQVVLRVTVQPMVVWLWIGGIVIALGTALSLVPSRGSRRIPESVPQEASLVT